jgi:hypothetical protein
MKMSKTTTIVIYPAIGFMGSAALVRVYNMNVNEVRAMGRTARERFDLAVEVTARFYNGVATPQVEERDIPTNLVRKTWAEIVIR